MKCPKCKHEVQKEDVNIQTDVAKCDNCNSVFKISDIVKLFIDDGFDMFNPPKGAWINKNGNSLVFGAKTSSSYGIISFFALFFSAPMITQSLIKDIILGRFTDNIFPHILSLLILSFVASAYIFCNWKS